jgi:glycosyltransferase involved in cell wall biosynthesis
MNRGRLPRLCFVGWADHGHVERWADYFARAGFDVSVVSFSGPGNYVDGVRQRSVGLKNRGPRWVVWKLRYLFWRLRPDIVHVHWAHFAVPVRRAWRGPLVVTCWGSDIYRRDQFSEREWEDMANAARASDFVTCDSEDLATVIRTTLGVLPARIPVIQWGVDTNRFSLHRARQCVREVARIDGAARGTQPEKFDATLQSRNDRSRVPSGRGLPAGRGARAQGLWR